MILTAFASISVDADGQQSQLLVDYGNGSYIWLDDLGDTTLLDAVKHSLESAGVEYTLSADGNSFTSVNGVGNLSIASVDCAWRFYIWSTVSYSWSYGEADGSRAYSGGTLALGFFPSSSLYPASTPFYSETWTQAYGDASASYRTGNTAPDHVAEPLEWVIKGTHGSIDTSILFAEGLLYCIAGGSQNAIGESGMPCIYCIDTETHEIAWSVTYSSSTGYEIMSPLIVGGMLIVYKLLIEWNEKMNLTAITEKDEVIVKHFADSILGLPYFDAKRGSFPRSQKEDCRQNPRRRSYR